jgi:hypothetical protein
MDVNMFSFDPILRHAASIYFLNQKNGAKLISSFCNDYGISASMNVSFALANVYVNISITKADIAHTKF